MLFFRLRRGGLRGAALLGVSVAMMGAAAQISGSASGASASLVPGDLLVATSLYQSDPHIVAGTTELPPGCSPAAKAPDPCGTAVANGDYPTVFNNDPIDGSFGVTSKILLDQLTPSGTPVGTIEVPNSTDAGVIASSDQMVTSFSSKSELALNLSSEGKSVTFMGYNAPVDTADVSNANTPGQIDPTAADPGADYRVVAELGEDGVFHFTETNAYTGDNGRAAIANDAAGVFYGAGNAGNGKNPPAEGVVTGAGAQLIEPSDLPESEQNPPGSLPSYPTPVGSFNVTQLGDAADKLSKDNNYRGLTIFNNVLYYSKGSGGNGVDTVYFVDTTGKACPSGGVGLPEPGAPLPTSSDISYVANLGGAAPGKTPVPGLSPENMCILKGFPTSLATNASDSTDYPFGIWFADPTTVYVADEGSGDNANATATASSNGLYSAAAASTTAGLQKWVFNGTQWNLAYTLQKGLNLAAPYVVSGYPTGLNSAPGEPDLPWAPATDGLRNITGRVNADGTATIWAETSTVSGSGDQGADPNELVSISDDLNAAALPANEQFTTVLAPTNATVVRGVSFTPGTNTSVTGNLSCNATYSGTTIAGNVTVPANSTCTLVDATVEGNVQVRSGGALLDTDSTIDGNLQTDGADWVDVQGGSIKGNLQVQQTSGAPIDGTTTTANELCGATVGGNVQVQNNAGGAPFDIGAAPACNQPLTIGGNLQVQNNAGTVAIGAATNGDGNSATNNIQVMNNTGGGSLTGNSAGGNCQLQNSPRITGTGNSAKGTNSCNGSGSADQIRHVLLISVDGMHQSDLVWYVAQHPNSALAQLVNGGAAYSNARTSDPSDSDPGGTALMTGGDPRTTGVYYDVEYNHDTYEAGTTSCTGPTGGDVVYDSPDDLDASRLDAGEHIPGIDSDPSKIMQMTGNPQTLLNPDTFPVDPKTCKPIWPHSYLQANTIFEVAKAAGMLTAWSDKHPVYESFNGPSGTGIDDLFTPEIDSNAIEPNGTPYPCACSWTGDNAATRQYDSYKVQAIINEIDGYDHSRSHQVGVPAIFGMNFQTVSTAEKLFSSEATIGGPVLAGGYLPGTTTPGPLLSSALDYVNDQLQRMLDEIQTQGLASSTAIVITAKHGQSPQDPNQLTRIKDGPIIDAINAAWTAAHPGAGNLIVAGTDDDLWQSYLSNTSQAAADFVQNYLWNHDATGVTYNGGTRTLSHSGLAKIYAGKAAADFFDVPVSDPRHPDVFGRVQVGVVYTGGTKIAEHGGDNPADRDVPILVYAPGTVDPGTSNHPVETTQVAPTILQLLGLDPNSLQAVQKEGTKVLPALH